jgi:hypothetical protein
MMGDEFGRAQSFVGDDRLKKRILPQQRAAFTFSRHPFDHFSDG